LSFKIKVDDIWIGHADSIFWLAVTWEVRHLHP